MSALTEAEARTKWCPETRVAAMSDNGMGFCPNRSGPSFSLQGMDRCQASDCMMWRWSPPFIGSPKIGYCGKGGVP